MNLYTQVFLTNILTSFKITGNEVIKTYISTKLADATIIEVCGPENCKEVKVKTYTMYIAKKSFCVLFQIIFY